MNPTIRDADITDVRGLSGVIEGCGLFSPQEADGFIDSLPDMLVDDDHLWLVTDGVVAAAYLTLDGTSSDVWNLWFIGCLPQARRQGHGTALIDAAEARARDRDGRILLVEISGVDGFDATRGFYLARGFAEQGRIADYYGAGDDKVFFAKRLTV